jgi:hypothetical protein
MLPKFKVIHHTEWNMSTNADSHAFKSNHTATLRKCEHDKNAVQSILDEVCSKPLQHFYGLEVVEVKES